MTNIVIKNKAVLLVLAFGGSFGLTFFILLPILLAIVGSVSQCGFPDGVGGCISQSLTIFLASPAIFAVLGLVLYDKLRASKK